MKTIRFLPLLLLGTCGLWLMGGPTASDEKAVKAAVMNYVEGWFQSDGDRLGKSMHPNLFKCRVEKVRGTQLEYLATMTAERLIAVTRHNGPWVAGKSYKSMETLYLDGRIAVVKAVSDGFYDIVNLAKINGEWKIVQVLWDTYKKEK